MASSDALAEVTVSEQILFEGRIVRLELLEVELPDGSRDRREIVRHADAVCAAVLTSQGQVVLVRQYRKALERAILEIPAGLMNPGEEPDAAVRRELAEEIGFLSGRVEYRLPCYASPGFCDERMHLYTVTEAVLGTPNPDPGEQLEIV
ncbi:MAG: NUDIX hydrolase, partial [Candidatus Eremiobacterota bacterium]